MSLVIDASLTVTWYFEDETTPAADAILDRVAAAGAVVPTLWRGYCEMFWKPNHTIPAMWTGEDKFASLSVPCPSTTSLHTDSTQ